MVSGLVGEINGLRRVGVRFEVRPGTNGVIGLATALPWDSASNGVFSLNADFGDLDVIFLGVKFFLE